MKKISGNTYITKKNDNVFLDQVPIKELTEKFETPLYILLENRIRENIKNLNEIFSSLFDKFECFYSLKANFLKKIIKIIKSERIGLEIIGLPELNLSINEKFNPKNIIGGGPYLFKIFVKKAIESGIREIISYNLEDLKLIHKIAEKYGIIQDVCLRINSGKYESKLGVFLDDETLIKLKKILKTCNSVRLTTILSHYGTQMNHISLFRKNVNNAIENFKLLLNNRIHVKNINFGGGFPEASILPVKQLQIFATELKTLLKPIENNINKIYLEPGRYIVGDAGVFLSKIIKTSSNRWFFLDIGNHICPKFAKCSLRFYNITRISEAHKFKASIAGIVPTDQDVLAKNYFFTKNIEKNDIVLVTNVGAYTLTFSNRFPYQLPKILLIKGDRYEIIFDPKLHHDFSIY
ncbi:MAG: diaminopimelate decarboxylase family protein [Promethearchaeota archaeon]